MNPLCGTVNRPAGSLLPPGNRSAALAGPVGQGGFRQFRFGRGQQAGLLRLDVGQPLVDVGDALVGAQLFLAAAGLLQFEHGQRQVLALRIVYIADAFGHRADVLHGAAGY